MAVTNVYLCDKSALARVARHTAVQQALVELDHTGVLATSPIIDLEIGYSARDFAEFDAVAADRRAMFLNLPLTTTVCQRALEVQRELVKIGHHRGPGAADLLIAATAELHDAVVVHYDADFDTIAAVTKQPVQWIVAAGSAC